MRKLNVTALLITLWALTWLVSLVLDLIFRTTWADVFLYVVMGIGFLKILVALGEYLISEIIYPKVNKEDK